MSWKSLIVLSLALPTIILGLAGCESLSPPSVTPKAQSALSGTINLQNNGIWVTGEGKVSVVSDVAILSLGWKCSRAALPKHKATQRLS